MNRCFKGVVTALGLSLLLLAALPEAKADQGALLWAGCGITKKAFMAELAKSYQKKTGIKINLQGGGATKGIRKAVKGEINIGGACRPIIDSHPEERNAYQVPVAWDALVVIVHPDNPVSDITFKQLQDIYRGRIENWKAVGGPDKPINLIARQGKISGVGRTLRTLVFANFNQAFAGADQFVRSSGPLEKTIETDRLAIGTTGISSAKRRNVKILQLNGMEPSYENIKNGNYVLYRPLYLVTRGNSANKMAKDFITYALSSEGRQIIRNAGTVPYSDAMGLVMKQIQQYERASERGLYSRLE